MAKKIYQEGKPQMTWNEAQKKAAAMRLAGTKLDDYPRYEKLWLAKKQGRGITAADKKFLKDNREKFKNRLKRELGVEIFIRNRNYRRQVKKKK